MHLRIACALCAVWAAFGCTEDVEPYAPQPYADGSADPQPEPADECVDSPPFAEVTAFAKCATCHDATKSGADRKSAPPRVNFDTAAGADAAAEGAVGMVRSGAMPPRASGLVLTDSEKQQLYAWASCK